MSKSKVSVIIPTYNSMAFIGDTLASVMNQTYEPFEIIVVDDASSDGTPAYLDATAKSNSKLHVIALSHNQGWRMLVTLASKLQLAVGSRS